MWNGRRCHCFEQAAINLVYTQSNLKEILERENFSTFSFDYYSADDINPATGRSSLETAKDAVAKCHDFIDHFDSTFSNLYLYGDTGIGKTFLSNCIAKELLDRGHSVIYFTAFQLFDILSKGVFKRDEEALLSHRNIFDCDLLIIDDLGTELSNSFTTSQLFFMYQRTHSAAEIHDHLHKPRDEPTCRYLFRARFIQNIQQLHIIKALRRGHPYL